MAPQLTIVDGYLYFAGNIILRRYPEGDCDSIAWPFGSGSYYAVTDRKNLAVALYDMYECGTITERTVALPDGTAFNIDMNMPRRSEAQEEIARMVAQMIEDHKRSVER